MNIKIDTNWKLKFENDKKRGYEFENITLPNSIA
jgi:hypothetical protein